MLTGKEFKEIFDKYFDEVRSFIYYRCGNADSASDIAQDVFMKLWEKRDELTVDAVRALLYKMANNSVVDKYRREVVEQSYAQSMTVDEAHSLSPDDELNYREMKAKYAEALSLMPETQRVVYLMSRNDDLKYTEIADCLDVGIKAVEKRMSLALKFLREKLLC